VKRAGVKGEGWVSILCPPIARIIIAAILASITSRSIGVGPTGAVGGGAVGIGAPPPGLAPAYALAAGTVGP